MSVVPTMDIKLEKTSVFPDGVLVPVARGAEEVVEAEVDFAVLLVLVLLVLVDVALTVLLVLLVLLVLVVLVVLVLLALVLVLVLVVPPEPNQSRPNNLFSCCGSEATVEVSTLNVMRA